MGGFLHLCGGLSVHVYIYLELHGIAWSISGEAQMGPVKLPMGDPDKSACTFVYPWL